MRSNRAGRRFLFDNPTLENRTLLASLPSGAAFQTQQWGLEDRSGKNIDIDAPEAWEITSGSRSVVVADIEVLNGVAINNPGLA